MTRLVFQWKFAGEEKTVKVNAPKGAHGVYQVLVDEFFQGQIIVRDGSPNFYGNNSIITPEDWQQLKVVVEGALD